MDIKAIIKLTAGVTGQQEVDKLRGSLSALEGTVGTVKKVLGALGVAFTAQQFGAWIKGSIDFADSLNDMRQKTGIAVEDLNALALAAEQNGTNIETVAGSLSKLGRIISDALGGNKSAASALKQFGIGLDEVRSGSISTTEILARIADHIQQMPDGLQKAAAAQKIFGKSASEIIPLLNAGGGAIRDARKELEDWGALITGDFASAADGFNDKLSTLGFVSKGYAAILANALIPALIGLAGGLSDGKEEVSGFAKNNNLQEWAEQSALSLASLIDVVRFLVQDLKVLFDTTQIAIQSVMSGYAVARNGPAAILGDSAAQSAVSQAVDAWNKQREEFFTDIGGLWNFDFTRAQRAVQDAIDKQKSEKKAGSGAGGQNLIDPNPVDPEADRALKQRNDELKRQNDLLSDYVLRENEAIEVLNLENEKVDMSAFAYQQLVEAKRHEYEVAKATSSMQPDMVAKYEAVADAMFATRQEVEKLNYEQSRTFEYGAKQALQEYADNAGNAAQQIGGVIDDAFSGMEDALVEFVKTGKLDFSSLIDSMIADLARLALKQAILGPLAQALGSAISITPNAMGGVMTSDGPMPLRSYAFGGIARSPQLALYGEGRLPEAYVPLPDGRNIPVKMQGNSSGNVQVVVNNNSGQQVQTNETTDGRGNRRIEVQIGEMVASEIRRPGSSANMAIRNSFRAAPALTGR